jgi:hypothetical protein
MKQSDDISVNRAAYGAAKQKDGELRNRLHALECEHDALQRAGTVSAGEARARLTAQATAVLEEDHAPASGDRLGAITANREERRVLHVALPLSERRVQGCRQAWSRAVSEARRTEYEKMAKRQTEALIALVEASAAVDRVRADIEKTGADCTLWPVTLRHYGRLEDHQSMARIHLRELVEHGFPVPDPAKYGLKQW